MNQDTELCMEEDSEEAGREATAIWSNRDRQQQMGTWMCTHSVPWQQPEEAFANQRLGCEYPIDPSGASPPIFYQTPGISR